MYTSASPAPLLCTSPENFFEKLLKVWGGRADAINGERSAPQSPQTKTTTPLLPRSGALSRLRLRSLRCALDVAVKRWLPCAANGRAASALAGGHHWRRGDLSP